MVFRNNMAWVSWVFSALFCAFVLAMTYVLLRDGSPQVYAPFMPQRYPAWFIWSVMAIFWTAALGLVTFALSQHCLTVGVRPESGVEITWRYPFRKRLVRLPASEVPPVSLVHSTDSEGDAYFYVRLLLPDGASVNLSEGHQLEACEAVCERFNQVLQTAAKGQST